MLKIKLGIIDDEIASNDECYRLKYDSCLRILQIHSRKIVWYVNQAIELN